jgi:predicted dehydrogenase
MERIRVGMIGGGRDAFIGAVHRTALRLDGRFELVAGCFSRDPGNTRETGAALGLSPGRCYGAWEELLAREAALPARQRIEAVCIVTPNHLHAPQAIAALEAGFHVDKPLATSVAEAEAIAAAAERSGRILALTHNYAGAPLVREARELVRAGRLGGIRKVYAEYLQGWLSEPIEAAGQKQAAWRTDPARAGPAGALGDIGTHAHHLVEHVTGLRVTRLLSRLESIVPGRALDDDGMVLFELEGGGSGALCASQVCFGRENGLRLRVFGTRGAVEWDQEHPNDLRHTDESGATRILRTATAPTGAASRSLTRLPPGHPEGYLESFANIYAAFARAVRGEPESLDEPFPGAAEGVRSARFVAAAIASSRSGDWVAV